MSTPNQLIVDLKKQVKLIMEESVTKKFIHLDGPSVTSFCVAIDNCLCFGLKRKVKGLFQVAEDSFVLIEKTAKNCEASAKVLKYCTDQGKMATPKRNSFKEFFDSSGRKVNPGAHAKYQWLRFALSNKLLDQIVQYLVDNSEQFYESDAVVSDAVLGHVLASLVVGPNNLDYARLKNSDDLTTDLPANEMIQRYRIHGCHNGPLKGQASPGPPASNSGLHQSAVGQESGKTVVGARLSNRSGSAGSSTSDDSVHGVVGVGSAFFPHNVGSFVFPSQLSTGSAGSGGSAAHTSPREYVQSLHQNAHSTLLYGKNNVVVQPSPDIDPLPGYLSLHVAAAPVGLVLKWTPNKLMRGGHQASAVGDDPATGTTKTEACHDPPVDSFDDDDLCCYDRSVYWSYALSLRLEEIVYVHCHQQPDNSGGTVVLVGHDGLQRPPLHFPHGARCLEQFLSCLEYGLLPHYVLDPPLWCEKGKGKVLPRLRRTSSVSTSAKNDLVDKTTRSTPVQDGSESAWSDSMASPPSGLANLFRARFSASSRLAALNEHEADEDSSEKKAEEKVNEEKANEEKKDEPVTDMDYVFRIVGAASSKPSSFLDQMLSTADDAVTPGLAAAFSRYFAQRSSPPSSALANSTPTTSVIEEGVRLPSGSDVFAGDTCRSFASAAHHRASVQTLCKTMRKQILCRAFYGWLAYVRHLRTVRTHLHGLIIVTPQLAHSISTEPLGQLPKVSSGRQYSQLVKGLTNEQWVALSLSKDGDEGVLQNVPALYETVYWGGIESMQLRRVVWPYLLGFYPIDSSAEQRRQIYRDLSTRYEQMLSDWADFEAAYRHNEKKESDFLIAQARARSAASSQHMKKLATEPAIFHSSVKQQARGTSMVALRRSRLARNGRPAQPTDDEPPAWPDVASSSDQGSEPQRPSFSLAESNSTDDTPGIVASVDRASPLSSSASSADGGDDVESGGLVIENWLVEKFGANLVRIEKDVARCDRSYPFYRDESNLRKLNNIMCTYVWDNLDMGYVQGMCDLAAPLLVVFDDEPLTYACFCRLMLRMRDNFPQQQSAPVSASPASEQNQKSGQNSGQVAGSGNSGGAQPTCAVDRHFANLRSLVQVMDTELYDHIYHTQDYTHFYFTYRWFLLDFKRELSYADVFRVWEAIWAAEQVSTPHFSVFIALALLEIYREIILENDMSFTDIMRFFNEMAEKHSCSTLLHVARSLVHRLQQLTAASTCRNK